MAVPNFRIPLLLQVFPDGIAFESELAVPDQHAAIAFAGHDCTALPFIRMPNFQNLTVIDGYGSEGGGSPRTGCSCERSILVHG